MSDNICYNGVGSLESGNHTKKQYLDVMNKNFKKDCSIYIKSLKCKSCKKAKKMASALVKKSIKNKTYKIPNKIQTKILNQINKCKKCKNNNTRKCNLKNYILFSGAELGICPKDKLTN